jgi:hypothetical protein
VKSRRGRVPPNIHANLDSAVEPGRQKLRNIERDPRVDLNLNSNAQGGVVVRVEDAPPATEVPEYVESLRISTHAECTGLAELELAAE